jgi:hypothetical protein
MRLSSLNTFILMCSIACLAACDTKPSIDKEKVRPKTIIKALDFFCDQATGCANVPVGMLHLGSVLDERSLSQRCLATRISKSKVLTSRYCVESSLKVSIENVQDADLYFTLPQKLRTTLKASAEVETFSSRSKAAIKVIGVSAASPTSKKLVQQSFVILEIDNRADWELGNNWNKEVTVSKIFEIKPEDKFWVYSAEEKWNQESLSYEIELTRSFGCEMVESPVFFPYATDKKSETFVVNGCDVLKGSAGSPLLNSKNEITGVMQARVDSSAIFNFVAERFRGLIDWQESYSRFFGLATHASCIFAECNLLGKQIVEISRFPTAGYRFLAGQKDKLAKIFRDNFPSPYSHFVWQVNYNMVRESDGTYSIESQMSPVCFTPSLVDFLRTNENVQYSFDRDKLSWGISAGLVKAKLVLNDKLQIAPMDFEFKVENFKLTANSISSFERKILNVEIYNPFKKLTIKRALPICSYQAFASWNVIPQYDELITESIEDLKDLFQSE